MVIGRSGRRAYLQRPRPRPPIVSARSKRRHRVFSPDRSWDGQERSSQKGPFLRRVNLFTHEPRPQVRLRLRHSSRPCPAKAASADFFTSVQYLPPFRARLKPEGRCSGGRKSLKGKAGRLIERRSRDLVIQPMRCLSCTRSISQSFQHRSSVVRRSLLRPRPRPRPRP